MLPVKPHPHFLLFLFLLLSNCSYFSRDVTTYPAVSSSDSLQIPMDQGAFIFKELSLSSAENEEPRLRGMVLNNTRRDWEEVEFVVEIFDQEGKPLEGAGYYGRHFVFANFKAGETKTIGGEEGTPIFGFQGANISKFDIRFSSAVDLASGESIMAEKAMSSSKVPQKKKELSQEAEQPIISPNLWTGNISFLLGRKYLNKEDWKPVELQNELGVEADFKSNQWPFSAVFGVLQSTGQGEVTQPVSSNVKGKTLEWILGGRKFFEYGSLQPFVSGGFVLLHTEANAKPSRKDTAHKGTGLWIESGGLWEFRPSVHFGGSLKYSYAKVKKIANGGGIHAGLLAGWQW